ncbi:hypothetical protein ES705_27704 [subsurface metagenome]
MDNHKIKAMITNKILRLALLLIGMTFISCDKDKDVISQDKILGTWISLDKSDTLDFVDNNNFYKSSVNMRYDHYDYQLENDSIEIGYSGRLYILVLPTTHKYHLDGNNLTIDFNNINCYGFDFQVTNYTKQSG